MVPQSRAHTAADAGQACDLQLREVAPLQTDCLGAAVTEKLTQTALPLVFVSVLLHFCIIVVPILLHSPSFCVNFASFLYHFAAFLVVIPHRFAPMLLHCCTICAPNLLHFWSILDNFCSKSPNYLVWAFAGKFPWGNFPARFGRRSSWDPLIPDAKMEQNDGAILEKMGQNGAGGRGGRGRLGR